MNVWTWEEGEGGTNWEIRFDINTLLLLLSLFSRVWLCVTPEMAAHQAPLSLGFSRQEPMEWVAISFSNAWKWKVKVKSLSCVRLSVTPWTAALQAPPSMGFSRQEYWSGVPLPSLLELSRPLEFSGKISKCPKTIALGGLRAQKVRPEYSWGRKWTKMCIHDGHGKRSIFLQLYFCSCSANLLL